MPKFSSKIGVIAATVGSAVGLGNVWRFPAEVQANGGALFLLVYILCIFILGIPVMTAEFALGRGGDSDAVGVFRKVTPDRKGWWLAGALAVLASYLILSFYMVVSGWTLEYLVQSVTGDLYASGSGDEAFRDTMGRYITGTYRPIVMTVIMIAANLLVLLKGVQGGIERMSNIMMPVLFLLLVIFCGVSLSLPGASEGLSFFLRPDFSALTPATVVNALGQAFFSLSLAMGILVTYASYYPAGTKLTRTAMTVSLLDLMVAILMGVIIFPAVMTFGLQDSNLAGSALVFVTLPEIFAQMGGHTLVVVAILPAAHRRGLHVDHIAGRGLSLVCKDAHEGLPYPCLSLRLSPAAHPQPRVLAFGRPMEGIHHSGTHHIRFPRHGRHQYNAPRRGHTPVRLYGVGGSRTVLQGPAHQQWHAAFEGPGADPVRCEMDCSAADSAHTHMAVCLTLC